MAYLENSLNIKISLISGWRLAAPMAGGGKDGVGGDVDSLIIVTLPFLLFYQGKDILLCIKVKPEYQESKGKQTTC